MGYVLWGETGVGLHSREDWIRGVCALLPEPPILLTADPERDLGRGLGAIAELRRTHPPHPTDILLLPFPIKSAKKAHILGWSANDLEKPTLHRLRRCGTVAPPDKRSRQLLEAAGLEKKIRPGPDLPFLVQRRIRPLQGAFRRDTVGLCPSRSPLPYEAYRQLIDYILMKTTFEIAIIPYDSTDYALLLALAKHFETTGRVRLRPAGDSMELRGDLSLCRMVVGMGGALAAWSCGVPALCLGASGRALGMGLDLFGQWQDAVVPLALLSKQEALTDHFRRFLRLEPFFRRKLDNSIPQRRAFAQQWRL